MSISKSEQRALGCQHYYAQTHFSNEPVLQRIGSSGLAGIAEGPNLIDLDTLRLTLRIAASWYS